MIRTIFDKKKEVTIQRDHNYVVQVGKGKKVSTKKMIGPMLLPCVIRV